MSPEQAATVIQSAVVVTREDIARAKSWLLKSEMGQTHHLVERWLTEQKLVVPREIDTDQPNAADLLLPVARAYSVRLAFYQAIWELVSTVELIAAGPPALWEASLTSRTSHYVNGIQLKMIRSWFPANIERPPFFTAPTTEIDVFLEGSGCEAIHLGIQEAIKQALECFRRGLFMPATVMLAAAAEATWTECGVAVAAKLSDANLLVTVRDQFASISRKVADIQKAVESGPGKTLLKAAGQNLGKVNDVEVWTTALREKRNALHWSKARSFIADHSETGTLLMAAPTHLGTLEAIRAAC